MSLQVPTSPMGPPDRRLSAISGTTALSVEANTSARRSSFQSIFSDWSRRSSVSQPHSTLSGRTATPSQDNRFNSWLQVKKEIDKARQSYLNPLMDPGTALACWRWVCAHSESGVDPPFPQSYIKFLKDWNWPQAGRPLALEVETYPDDNTKYLSDWVHDTLKAMDNVKQYDARTWLRVTETHLPEAAFSIEEQDAVRRIVSLAEGLLPMEIEWLSTTESHSSQEETAQEDMHQEEPSQDESSREQSSQGADVMDEA